MFCGYLNSLSCYFHLYYDMFLHFITTSGCISTMMQLQLCHLKPFIMSLCSWYTSFIFLHVHLQIVCINWHLQKLAALVPKVNCPLAWLWKSYFRVGCSLAMSTAHKQWEWRDTAQVQPRMCVDTEARDNQGDTLHGSLATTDGHDHVIIHLVQAEICISGGRLIQSVVLDTCFAVICQD